MAQPVSPTVAAAQEKYVNPVLPSVTKPDVNTVLILAPTDAAEHVSVVRAALLTVTKPAVNMEPILALMDVAEQDNAVPLVLLPAMKPDVNTELTLVQTVAAVHVNAAPAVPRLQMKPVANMVLIPAPTDAEVPANAAPAVLLKATRPAVNMVLKVVQTDAEGLEPAVKLNRPAHLMLIKQGASMAHKVVLTAAAELALVANQRVMVSAVQPGLLAVKQQAGQDAPVSQASFHNHKTVYVYAEQNIHIFRALTILFSKRIITIIAAAEHKS